MNAIIDLAVKFGPTILFILIVLVATLTGIIRGFRKSMIFAVHALIAALLCIGLFFLCTRVEAVDKFFLSIADFLFGGSLAEYLGVTQPASTLKEVLTYYVPTLINIDDLWNSIINDNGEYIATLVDLVYNLVFAIVCSIIYEILVGILYIVYLIFYPEKKYKKRRKKAFAESKVDSTYRKNKFLGGLVGLSRGLITGVITLSLIGNLLYIAVGTGDGEAEELDFGNEQTNMIYNAYRSIESYGTTGIYKVLNSFTDTEDQPYYLFAVDLVFSGGIHDEELGIDENVSFREELGAYTALARDTINLLIKYGGDEVVNMVNNPENASTDFVVELMKDPAFQNEFEAIIIDFDSQTYVINMAFSFVNSFIANVDDLGLGEIPNDLIKLLFQKGFLTDKIPDEREMLTSRMNKAKSNTDGDIHPYIHIGHLIEKQDVMTIFDILTTVIQHAEDQENQTDALYMVKKIIPLLANLSILDTRRSEELDPVFGRLYAYLDNAFLSYNLMTGEYLGDGISYSEISAYKVEWIKELNSIVNVALDALKLYENVYTPDAAVLDIVLSIFDDENEKYDENIELYHNVRDIITDSKLLGTVLSSNAINTTIVESLQLMFPNIYLPDYIEFENKYDDDGNLIQHGEIYLLLSGLEILGDPVNKGLLDTLTSGESLTTEFLYDLSDALHRVDHYGYTLMDYLTESNLLRSIISTSVIDASGTEGMPLYVPYTVRETNKEGEYVNLIKKDPLNEVLSSLSDLLPIIDEINAAQESGENGIALYESILHDEAVIRLLDLNNHIIEGSISKMLIDTFVPYDAAIGFYIPTDLHNPEAWLSVNGEGEFKSLINFITLTDVSIANLLETSTGNNPEGEQKPLTEVIKEFTEDDVDRLFKSKVLHHTVSKMIDNNKALLEGGNFEVIIPEMAYLEIPGEDLYLIKKQELANIFTLFINIDLNAEPEELISYIVLEKEMVTSSYILSASMISFIVNDESLSTKLQINDDNKPLYAYTEQGSPDVLKGYDNTNIWYSELNHLFDSLDEVFGVSNGNVVNFNLIDKYTNDLVYTLNETSYVKPNKTRIEVCCASELVRNLMTNTLDENLDRMFDLDDAIIEMAKEDGVYKNEEILAIANALDIFGMEIGKSPNNNELFDAVLHLNEPYKNGRTKLQAVYESVIIRNHLSNVLTDELVKLNEGSEVNVKLALEEGLRGIDPNNPNDGQEHPFDIEEISATIDGIKAIYGENATMDELGKEPDQEVLRKNSNIVLESDIIRIVLSPNLKPFVDEAIKESQVPLTGVTDEYKVYKKEELTGLFNAYDRLYDEDNESFDINAILSLSDSELNEMLNSKIVRLSITTELAIILGDEATVSQKLMNELKDEEGIYTKSEIAALIGSIRILSGADENTTLEDAVNMAITNSSDASMLKANLKTIYDSDIVAGIITKQIENVPFIKDHPNAHIIPGDCTTAYVYKQNEIKSLLDLVENSFDELTDQDDVISKISDGAIIDNIDKGKAYLLVATVSYFIIWEDQEHIYVPYATLDDNQIVYKEEIAAFLRSLNILGVTSLSNGFKFIVPNNFEGLFDSRIIRTTFTQLIGSNVDSSQTLYVQTSNASKEHVIRGSKTEEYISINEEELVETFTIFIKADLFESGTSKLNTPTYQDIFRLVDGDTLTLDELAESDIMKYMVSDIISDLVKESPFPITPTEKDDVFILTDGVQEKTHSYHNIKNFEYLFKNQ